MSTGIPNRSPAPTLVQRLDEAVWIGVPLILRRFSTGLAVATTDGLYLAIRPVVGLAAPAAAFMLGLVAGGAHPDFAVIFTEALWLLIFVAALGAISGALGLYFTLGFASADLALGEHPLWESQPESVVGKHGSWLIMYLLLGLLAVAVPIAAKSVAAEFVLPPAVPRALRGMAAVGSLVLVTALLVFVWVQSAPLLARPVFVWADKEPTVAAIAPLQEHGGWVIAAATLATVIRVLIQLRLARPLTRGRAGVVEPDPLGELQARFRTPQPVVPMLTRMPIAVRLIVRAGLLTALLSGLFSAYWEAGLTFLVLLAGQVCASPLVPLKLGAYGRVVHRVPRLIRVLLAVIPVSLLGSVVLGYSRGWDADSFFPFLLLTVLSAVLTSLLNPRSNHSGGAA